MNNTRVIFVCVFCLSKAVVALAEGWHGGILPQLKGGYAVESAIQTALRENSDTLKSYYGDEVTSDQAKAVRQALLNALHQRVSDLTQNVDQFRLPPKTVNQDPSRRTAEEKSAWYGNFLILTDNDSKKAYFISKDGRSVLGSRQTDQLWFAAVIDNHLVTVEQGSKGEGPSLSIDGRMVKSVAITAKDEDEKKKADQSSMGLYRIRTDGPDVDPIDINFGFNEKGQGLVQINGQSPILPVIGDPLVKFFTDLKKSFY